MSVSSSADILSSKRRCCTACVSGVCHECNRSWSLNTGCPASLLVSPACTAVLAVKFSESNTMTIDESSPAVHDSGDGNVSLEEREKRLAAALEEQAKVEKLAASRLFFVR